MSTPIKTQGLILKEFNFNEADKIFVIFSEKLGKISCIAKGVRRNKSKMRGFLQLFTYAELHLHKGKTMYTIIGGEIICSFPEVKKDLSLFSYANYIAELLEALLPSAESNETLFQLTVSYFHLLSLLPVSQLTSCYLLKLLRLTGFVPEFSSCVLCNVEIQSSCFFSLKEGGSICPDCVREQGMIQAIPINIVKNLQKLLCMEFAQLGRLKITNKDQELIEEMLYQYMEYIIEKPVYSMKFLREIRGIQEFTI